MNTKELSSVLNEIIRDYIKEDKREAVNLFLELIQNFNYAIVGGASVSLWTDGKRAVSPEDFDIKILPEEEKELLKTLKDNGFNLKRKNAFIDSTWLVFEKDGQGFDIGIAGKEWDITGIKKAKSFNYKGFNVRVIPIEYLIISKLFAGRSKDYKDIVLLLKSGKVDIEILKSLVKRYLPSELSELENLILYANEIRIEEIEELFRE